MPAGEGGHWRRKFLFCLHSLKMQTGSKTETAQIPVSVDHCHFCPAQVQVLINNCRITLKVICLRPDLPEYFEENI